MTDDQLTWIEVDGRIFSGQWERDGYYAVISWHNLDEMITDCYWIVPGTITEDNG